MVKVQIMDVKSFLTNTVSGLESFLNSTTIDGLLSEKQGDKEYYKRILGNLRKLLVYCEEGLDACSVILQSESFPKGAAEKTLYGIYHKCIEEFFHQKMMYGMKIADPLIRVKTQ